MFGDTTSLKRRVRDLEERLERLETRAATDRLGVLEVIEKISRRLEWRERKRAESVEQDTEPQEQLEHTLGFTRRYGGNGGR